MDVVYMQLWEHMHFQLSIWEACERLADACVSELMLSSEAHSEV